MRNLKSVRTLILLTAIITIGFNACIEDQCSSTRHFIEMIPVYAFPDDFRVEVTTDAPREMEETGKFYFFRNFIFVNEKHKGIHVIDNNDPENPENLHFINIPGNVDISIKGNILYADSYVDLLSIDISDITSPRILCRDEEVFASNGFQEGLGYLIEWEPTENTMEIDCTDPNFGKQQFSQGGRNIFVAEDVFDADGPEVAGGDNNAGSGQGGSQNRFTVIYDFLYVLNNTELIAYDLEDPAKPRQTQTTYVNWNIETIFPYGEYIFIGSQTGMYIYDISNPASPEFVSNFDHAQACDPVFVSNDIAYVTLREGTWCNNAINQLDVLDVSDIRRPRLIKSYDMDHPHGLSVIDNTLYLCEGRYGLKVFETEDLENITENKLDHVEDYDAYDAISLSKEHLLVVGKDGLIQFDTSDPDDLKELSIVAVK